MNLTRLVFFLAALGVMPGALSRDLPGTWVLEIRNPDQQVVVTMKLQFTSRKADVCTTGDWNVVRVGSAKTTDAEFFPLDDELSWRIEDGQLTIGRNGVCDSYLWLEGNVDGTPIEGDYVSIGKAGRTPEGRFTLRPAKP